MYLEKPQIDFITENPVFYNEYYADENLVPLVQEISWSKQRNNKFARRAIITNN
jgi:hypothetical protein